MSERTQIFTVDELQIVTCQCPRCQNVLSYNVSTEPRYGIPARCPTCGEELESLALALAKYRDFFKTVADSKLAIRLSTTPSGE